MINCILSPVSSFSFNWESFYDHIFLDCGPFVNVVNPEPILWKKSYKLNLENVSFIFNSTLHQVKLKYAKRVELFFKNG